MKLQSFGGNSYREGASNSVSLVGLLFLCQIPH